MNALIYKTSKQLISKQNINKIYIKERIANLTVPLSMFYGDEYSGFCMQYILATQDVQKDDKKNKKI